VTQGFDQSDDEELARQARAGSSVALAALVSAFADRLYRYLLCRSASRHDADDLLQETFLRAMTNLHRYQPGRRGGSFAAWLFTIAGRLAAEHHRRGRRLPRPTADIDTIELPDRRSAGPDESAESSEQRQRLWSLAADALPESQFTALWLMYREDRTVKQIAVAMGKTQIHVKVLLHRARRRLMKLNGADIQAASPEPALRKAAPRPAGGEACGAV